jgi:hypothetical protein
VRKETFVQPSHAKPIKWTIRQHDTPAIAIIRGVLTDHGGAWLSDLIIAARHLGIGEAAVLQAIDELEDAGIVIRIPTDRLRVGLEPDVAICLRGRKAGAR